MTPVLRTIKNISLFLFGLVMIAAGYKVNDDQVQAKREAARVKAEEIAENARALEMAEMAKAQEMAEMARAADKGKPRKFKTTVEKAKPEQASASQNTNGKPAGASAGATAANKRR